ncbi:MAG: PH domain-containing protein [Candidatus Nanopelagicales bacterium]|jgi:membrane protein YdbS with pleckstrin-like domain|nr:PH domain-containing protein [Actinomycetota bacterium]HNL51107.1 PH domain-containing protein [Actinomycetota bacterium]HNO15648.1 PH domain-containing protein [Actinomycetota bacterium]
MASKVDVAFLTGGDTWQSLSPKLIAARRLVLALFAVAFLIGAVVAYLVGPAWLAGVIAAVGLLILVIGWPWIGRRVRSWGYSERDDDLVVGSGIWFRRLVVVPYGRLQLVDVKAGPIDRAFGLTSVQLHTAAATSDAAIPGLEPQVAADLRDRLAARGEQRSAGL